MKISCTNTDDLFRIVFDIQRSEAARETMAAILSRVVDKIADEVFSAVKDDLKKDALAWLNSEACLRKLQNEVTKRYLDSMLKKEAP